MPAGGRFLRAVPYSSPILKSVPELLGGGALDDGGGSGASDMAPSYGANCTAKRKLCSFGPYVFHGPRKLVRRQSVQDVGCSQPCPPCLQDAIMDLLHMRRVVVIGVNDDLYAVLPRHAQVAFAQ